MKNLCLTLMVLWALPALSAWDSLQEHLLELKEAHHIPHMGLVIFDKGEAQLVKTWGKNATPQTPFRIGSISKTFTALGLLLLAEEKQLDLHQAINPITPVNNRWHATSPVQLIHLLELTGGFTDLGGELFNNNSPLTLAQALKLSQPSTSWQPGLQHSYSNLPPGLTAAAIEHFSHTTFERYQQEKVFAPLGMNGVSYLPLEDLPGGFMADGKTPIPYWHVTFNAFGAMNISTQAMAHGLVHLFGGGELSAQVLHQMTTPSSSLAARSGFQFDYAAGMYPRVSHGQVFYGHGGDADGYRSRFGLLPQLQRGYYVVINTDNPGVLRKMVNSIEATLVKNQPTNSPPSIPTTDDFDGEYYPSTTRFGQQKRQAGLAPRLIIKNKHTHLSARTMKRNTRLYSLGADQFRRENDPVATVVFLQHAGKTYLSGELGNFIRLDQAGCQTIRNACEKPSINKRNTSSDGS